MNKGGSLRTVVIAALLLAPAFGQTVQLTVRENHFTVTDRTGRFVTDLNRDDFTLYDNDVRQDIDDFNQKLQSPVSIAVVIDRSESVVDKFPFVLNAAAAFVATAIREQDDQGTVVAFDSKVYLLQDWTPNAMSLMDNIHKLTPAGGTSLFDAVYKTCRDKFNGADMRQKVVVLITDGEDTTSRATFDQALQMAKLSGASIYVIGIRTQGSLNSRELQGRRVLTNLAELTGGRIFYPEGDREQQLTSLFQTLQVEMRNEYSVGYYLNAPLDNTFHQIRIETKDKGLVVHTPKGYYARKLTETQ